MREEQVTRVDDGQPTANSPAGSTAGTVAPDATAGARERVLAPLRGWRTEFAFDAPEQPWSLLIDGREYAIVTDGYVLVAVPCESSGLYAMPERLADVARRYVARESLSEPVAIHGDTLRAFAGVAEPDAPPCVTCRGAGTVTCEACDGDGRTDCECRCGDAHEAECDTCAGRRHVPCEACSSQAARPAVLMGGVVDRRLLAKCLRAVPRSSVLTVEGLRSAAGVTETYWLSADGWRAVVRAMRNTTTRVDFARPETWAPAAGHVARV